MQLSKNRRWTCLACFRSRTARCRSERRVSLALKKHIRSPWELPRDSSKWIEASITDPAQWSSLGQILSWIPNWRPWATSKRTRSSYLWMKLSFRGKEVRKSFNSLTNTLSRWIKTRSLPSTKSETNCNHLFLKSRKSSSRTNHGKMHWWPMKQRHLRRWSVTIWRSTNSFLIPSQIRRACVRSFLLSSMIQATMMTTTVGSRHQRMSPYLLRERSSGKTMLSMQLVYLSLVPSLPTPFRSQLW